MSLGAYLGILCDTKFFKGTHRDIHNTSIGKGILRLLVTVTIFSPFFFFMYYISFKPSFLRVLFIFYVLPAFVSGFVFFAFSRLIFQKCKLVTSDVKKNIQDGQGFKGDNLSDFSYDSEDEDA